MADNFKRNKKRIEEAKRKKRQEKMNRKVDVSPSTVDPTAVTSPPAPELI